MKFNKKRFLGILLFWIGVIIILNSFSGITGFVISGNIYKTGFSLIGLVFVIGGLGIFMTKLEYKLSEDIFKKNDTQLSKIDSVNYQEHALKRMEERKIFPTVIKHALKNGKHYKMKITPAKGESQGATDLYVLPNAVEYAPGQGKIGERIISVNPERKRKFENLLVMTTPEGNIRTVITKKDSQLKAYIKLHTKK